MDNWYLGRVFPSFVCGALSLLLGLHLYVHLLGTPDVVEGNFSDIKYVVMQLTRGLTEVNRKHEHLQTQMERIATALPNMAAAAGRARDALEPSLLRRGSSQQALDLRDYDRQVADYALESAGGRIIDTGDTVAHVLYESPVGWALHVVAAIFCRDCHGASVILRPSTLPGECWAFKGSKGEAIIRLLGSVHITGISIEHIPAHIAPTREISSAPRMVQLQGLEFRNDPYPHNFGTFEYDWSGKPIQYFEVGTPSKKSYNLVRVLVSSNWGNKVYTCVYRVRVHGDLASEHQNNNRDSADLFNSNK